MSAPVCYIVAAGEGFVPFAPCEGDLVIAADGGCRHLAAVGVRPDLVVGDLDSCESLPDGVPVQRHPVRKDETDTELALRIGYDRGYREFVVLGGLGGREDHSFANFSLLLYMKQRGANVILRSETTDVCVIFSEDFCIEGRVGDVVSLFALGGAAHGVTLHGLSYPLTNATLTPDVPLGVSNELTHTVAHVTVREGALLCFHVHAPSV